MITRGGRPSPVWEWVIIDYDHLHIGNFLFSSMHIGDRVITLVTRLVIGLAHIHMSIFDYGDSSHVSRDLSSCFRMAFHSLTF
jgi:hypothetical protein